MTEVELIILLFTVLGLFAFAHHKVVVYSGLGKIAPGGVQLAPVLVALGLAMMFLFWLLANWAAHDVVDSGLYRFFYQIIGLGWVAFALSVFKWCGLSLRDDVFERRNSAVAIALGGGVLGSGVIYALANTGDGPGWWCVIVAAGLSQMALFLGWWVVLITTKTHHRLTVDRDTGTGLRAGFWMLGAGILLGRAAAGTWTSLEATWFEFLEVARFFPWLIVAAVVVEWLVPRASTRAGLSMQMPLGLCLGAAHVTLAVWLTLRMGPWQ